MTKLETLQPGDICHGFELIKKEYVASKEADLYTLRHVKSGAEALYFDRADENKTFSIAFKTLPEDNTGVFHILEHSVLNGSRKFPVKEPFVSMLQNSMQTFLNAMTYSDKTVFPVSSRNEQDLFNLMMVYLDGVLQPLIYEKPEIFMQEGWHYEYEEDEQNPAYYNGVVLSEMKGAFADVDQLMGDELNCLLFPDNSYGHISGGHPDMITDLTYEKFIETHKKFYHPSNAKIFLDGHMEIERFLQYIDEEYLSKYDYHKLEFDFVSQEPKAAEKTVYYEAQEGEEELAHLVVAKILGTHDEVEKLYAAKTLADYLTGSNEAPLKRAFLEQGLAQDVSLMVQDEMYQPAVAFVARNADQKQFDAIKSFLPEAVKKLLADGLDKEALLASVEHMAFMNREITEPYGVELALRAYAGWLYGDDPLTYIDNADIFDSLRKKIGEGYFEDLLQEMLGDVSDKSYLYILPSLTKGEDDAKREAEKLARVVSGWDEKQKHDNYERFVKMQEWQQSMDDEEVLACLPHLELTDVADKIKPVTTHLHTIEGTEVLQVEADTNGIAYLNLYFDISDFTSEELQMVNVLTSCFGELRTEHYSGDKIQTMVKNVFGNLYAKVEVTAKPGDLEHCRPYLLVSASVLEKNVQAAIDLLEELLIYGRYDETDKIYETVVQNDYMVKQSLIANGHAFAITKALSAFSAEGAVKEILEGESFARWFADLTEHFEEKQEAYSHELTRLAAKAFAGNRLFVGYCGEVETEAVRKLVSALPVNETGAPAEYPVFDREDAMIEIPGGVGFSAIGCNLYAAGSRFDGAWSVLSSLMSFGYLWGMVRVQGGAYGTGMVVRRNGDVFAYSYRDPNVANTRMVYGSMADFMADFLSEPAPLDDIIIGTLNTVDPLLDPAGICDQECIRYLKGITAQDVDQIRKEILGTTDEKLGELVDTLRTCTEQGKFCVVGSMTQDDSSK